MAGKRVKKALRQPRGSKARGELVILTGLSGSGKLSALKAFEDLGYYSVDNLPLDLVPRFADLIQQSKEGQRAALVVDVREGMRLDQFPAILKRVRKVLPTQVVFLEASDDALVRRFSETRRPHPLGRSNTVLRSIKAERKGLIRSATWRISCWIRPSSMCTIFARILRRSLNVRRATRTLPFR